MNEDQFSAAATSLGGRIEEATGAAINDRGMQAEGLGNQAKGSAQGLLGDAKEMVRDTYDRIAPVTREKIERVTEVTREHSVLAMLAAGTVGFALALALRSNNTSPRGSWSA